MNTTLSRCQFCAAYYTPPGYFRSPSETCDNCWLQIQAKLAAVEQHMFTKENWARVNYRPERFWVQ